MHKPIFFKDLSLSFVNKNCFEDFSAKIYAGSRIAIIGRNGSGKSSLLQILARQLIPTDGEVIIANDLRISYVEQTINDFYDLSGGQRLNKRLSEALARLNSAPCPSRAMPYSRHPPPHKCGHACRIHKLL